MIVAAIVAVVVVANLIVAVHVHGNANVDVTVPVDDREGDLQLITLAAGAPGQA